MNELVIIKDGDILVDDAFMAIKKVEDAALELKEEENHLAQKRKNLEMAAQGAKDFIKKYMRDNGLAEICGEVVKYTLSKSNPKLNIIEEKLIPKEYLETTISTKIRTDAIKDQLKMGDVIPGVELEESWALKIGVNK